MTPSPALPAAILETILTRLAVLFLAATGGDTGAARAAANQMLMAYNPRNEDELSLAANIVAFTFQALEALGQAADPDMPITRILRLRSGAVSLSREAEKARRGLTRLQKSQPQPEAQPDPVPAPPATQAAADPKPLTWSQNYQKRMKANRIAEKQKKAQARAANRPNPTPSPHHAAIAQ